MKSKNNYTVFKKGIFLICFFTLLVITSCQKYTELNPLSTLSESTTFSTPANIELAMAGVYSTAATGSYYATIGGSNIPRGYPFGGAAIEQAEMRGEDMVNLSTFYAVTYLTSYDPTTANNVNMWSNLYALINQANVLIAGVETAASKGVITATVANQYEAEARFLRALAYHELLINFCRPYADGNGSNPGVPYRTEAVTSTDALNTPLSLGRGIVADDYSNILTDLDYAETNLPGTRSTYQITRATKGAAIAFKTRIKLHMGDWAGVITEGAKLGTSTGTMPYSSPIGAYVLTASPDGPFTSFTNNTESVFSIENSAASNGGINGALASMFGPSAIAGTTFGRGLVATSPNLYNAAFWVTGDLRRTLLQVQQSTTNAKYFFNYKYRDPLNKTDYTPIIRYAEVLLNVAEAYARTTALDPKALSLLNAVRNRAVTNVPNQYTILNFPSGNSLIQAILNERRIEFAGEGRRWPDITRLSQDPNFAVAGGGIPAKVLPADLNTSGSDYNVVTRPVVNTNKAAIPYTDYRYLWPIPVTETSANPTLAAQQNPGYN